ncbi:TonB-dependent receptor [Sphingopyxis sp.]|uniref:TonB-dependent receptor n=1 Tax=Sphingopyxis sp. TaxID=1908224 RepID=UPI002FC8B32C
MRYHSTHPLGALALCLAWSQAATAQEAETGTQGGLEEIVVTAQKREENLQKVPLAVSAVTASTFDRYASSDISDLSGSIPNVIIGEPTPGGSSIISFAIRGIQYAENEKTIEPPIGVVIDGIFSGTAQGGLLQTFDLERVEVLRGPQGTLFGKNTTGGAINAIRTRPTGQFGARIAGTLGTFDRRELRAVVNFPIVEDVLAGKAAFFYEHVDGFRNVVFPGRRDGDRRYWSASGTLLFTPSTSFEALLTYDHVKDRSESTPVLAIYQAGPTTLPTTPAVVVQGETPCRVFGFCPPLDTKGSRINGSGIAHNDLDAITLNARLDVSDDIKLVSVTGWRKSQENIVTDFDATELLIFQTQRPEDNFQQFSQELRLEGTIGDRVNFVAGGFYYRGHYDSRLSRIQDLGYIRGVPGLIGVYSQFFPSAPITGMTNIDHVAKSYAAFAQLDVEFIDDLTLTLGGRYTHDRKNILYELLNPDGSVVGPAQGALVPQSIQTSASWSKFTPRVALKYQFSPDTLAYASFTRGYNAGGYSGRAPDISTVGPYNPETVDSYEIGLKTELLDRTLRLNVAAFRNDYNDKQEEVSRATTVPPYFGTTITNASAARIQGIEIEATAVPTSGLTATASFGYLDAKYRNFVGNISGLGVTDNSALKLRRAPQFTVTTSADYSFAAAGGEVSVGARYRLIDETELLVTNDPAGHVEAGGFLDTSLGYERETSGVTWSVKLYGRNLTNTIRKSIATRIGGFINFIAVNRGREGGVELTLKF